MYLGLAILMILCTLVSLFKNTKVNTADICEIKNTISIHDIKNEDKFYIHKRILDRKTDL